MDWDSFSCSIFIEQDLEIIDGFCTTSLIYNMIIDSTFLRLYMHNT